MFLHACLERMTQNSCNSSSSKSKSGARCKCGTKAPICTTWTVENPGRKFLGCSNYKWVELEIRNKGKEIANKFIAKMEGMQERIMELERKNEDAQELCKALRAEVTRYKFALEASKKNGAMLK
ncbi:hypothetical protein ACH5RR_021355 [Cinchona calisaya]|uniref:Zinc finger GRF-type domain-containing protein n=1 Tax=Cinchona calisaya TaxID=153742 RepID=A0ABD2ZH27_9GENT